MSWISALAPWQWAVMLSVPPLIVLLYFLKLRRSPLLVPSTYLWRRTVEDIQVNSLWQRLRNNLLLLLQLLFILLLILACLRPGFRSSETQGDRKIFLLDNSASMQSTDVAPSRFEFAKDEIRKQIRNLNDGDVAMLIAFSNRADVRQGFTSDRSRLLAALDSTQATNRTSNIAEALRAAAGLANPGRSSFGDMTDLQVAEAMPAEIEIYSDGQFPNANDFNLGNLTPKYIPIGTAESDNVGIVAFSVDRSLESRNLAEAYGRIQNAGTTEQTVTVALRQNDDLLDASELTIPAGEARGVTFSLEGTVANAVYTLDIDHIDSLSVDNKATAALRPDRRIEVLVVSDGSQALQTVMATPTIAEMSAATFITPDTYRRWSENNFAPLADAGINLEIAFDLIILDGVEITTMPPANTLIMGGLLGDKSGWSFGEKSGPVIIVDWDRADPLMQFLTMSSVQVVQGQSVAGPEGSRILMRADNGPIFSIGPRGAYQDAVLGFGLRAEIDGEVVTNTDWPIKQSFPVFIFAALENLGGATRHRSNLSVRPGDAAVLNVPPRLNEFLIVSPDGTKQKIERDSAGQVIWTSTEQQGLYTVATPDSPDQPLDAFVVNLASSDESKTAIASDLQFGYQNIAATTVKTPQRQELWRWLLVVGLMVLVLEWTVFSKRVFV